MSLAIPFSRFLQLSLLYFSTHFPAKLILLCSWALQVRLFYEAFRQNLLPLKSPKFTHNSEVYSNFMIFCVSFVSILQNYWQNFVLHAVRYWTVLETVFILKCGLVHEQVQVDSTCIQILYLCIYFIYCILQSK